MALKTFLALLLCTLVVPTALGSHPACTPTAADPASYIFLVVDGRGFYDEERGTSTVVPIPGAGLLLGESSWRYEETWALDGLQRGGRRDTLTHDCLPNPGNIGPISLCRYPAEDPIVDEHCGHGPDVTIL